ncbi:hypothetical protein [Marinitoga sp. 38H-ov]|nr:hypothetical protein [Marinitoga sp. 38H-ov]
MYKKAKRYNLSLNIYWTIRKAIGNEKNNTSPIHLSHEVEIKVMIKI